MSRKAKGAPKAKKNKPEARPTAKTAPSAPTPSAAAESPALEPTDRPMEPVTAGDIGWLWFIGAIFVVVGVGWWFKLDVNRVFDVPKAVVLKVGGCGLFAAWTAYALFGPGVRWRSARIFAAPVLALAGAVCVSTLLSFDLWTSFNGVYERQFGLQGFLACVGLYFLVSTGISGRRGAWAAIGVLSLVGGTIGIYAAFQAYGVDPFPFFWNRPHNKVYSFLGNATFAGNALALVFPVATAAAGVAAAVTVGSPGRRSGLPTHILMWFAGFAGVLALQILPGALEGMRNLSLEPIPRLPPGSFAPVFAAGLVFGGLVLVGATLLGTWGPKSIRLDNVAAMRAMDAIAAGAMAAMAVGIFMGLLFTRTRGAWVGTGVAFFIGIALLPELASGTKALKPIRIAVWGGLAFVVVLFTTFVFAPTTFCGEKTKNSSQGACWVYAETIRSIPAAFDPNRIDYGKGQGTRRYLWTESPRVLTSHSATLQRHYDDRQDYVQGVSKGTIKDLGLTAHEAPDEGYRTFDANWRSAAVWLFGIGIETYRYAFMSHKSKRLEALDPMTNHDNPHNNYLYVFASFGLLGFAAYVWLLVSLLYQATWRFILPTRPVINKTSDGHGAGLVESWSFAEANRDPQGKLLLQTKSAAAVAAAVRTAHPDWDVEHDSETVTLRQFDADAVLDSLAGVYASPGGSRTDRAMALGVITSFFSYALYSLAGFDSVACSVFFFFLLGATAAMFSPNTAEVPDNLLLQLQRQWAAFRGVDVKSLPALPSWSSAVVGLIVVPLLLLCAYRATVVMRADAALVGSGAPKPETRLQYYEQKVQSAKNAVRLNPNESFYKQRLSSGLSDLAVVTLSEAQAGRFNAKEAQKLAARYQAEAEEALYAALDHAWAPENIYIALFQLHYQKYQVYQQRGARGPAAQARAESEAALERALVHSPHLGAVRANLASLQLDRKALDEAEANARWVLEVDMSSYMAWRVLGRVHQLKGDLKNAAHFYDQAVRRSRNRDRVAQRYLAEVQRQLTSTTGR